MPVRRRVVRRRALVVGINTYEDFNIEHLNAAASDARTLGMLLARNLVEVPLKADHAAVEAWLADWDNWQVTLVTDYTKNVRAKDVKTELAKFFPREPTKEFAKQVKDQDLLFYFSGHAVKDEMGVIQLMAYDREVIPFGELITNIQASPAKSITIILDCCFSGSLGDDDSEGSPGSSSDDPFRLRRATLKENVTILTASLPTEIAVETPLFGLFTEKLTGGLRGAAADILGNVTSLALYAHASEAFGPEEQRPTFKSNATTLASLRRVRPRIDPTRLEAITAAHFFPEPDAAVTLDQRYEGIPSDPGFKDREKPGAYVAFKGSKKQTELDFLKEWRGAGLVGPADGKTDFFFLCRDGGDVLLTPLGKYYWSLINRRQEAARTAPPKKRARQASPRAAQ